MLTGFIPHESLCNSGQQSSKAII
uniref:Uncharacterized protein n=1 Tax=Arundo donax TaxID=35708 RepID=A0A0A9FXZ6_ARUDO